MSPDRAHRCWTTAYFASWMLAAGGLCGVLAAIAGSATSGRVIDDGAALFGLPIGAVLGFFAARSTRPRRGVHRALIVGGSLAAAAGTAVAVCMFAAARAARGDGWWVGLGEVVAGVASACVAAIGIACLAAGTFGRLAARTAPG